MTSFLNAMPGAVAQGLIWGIMAIGVYLTYQILSISDLTVDGSFCTGGAVCVVMMTAGYNVWVAMLAAALAGMLAGLATGFFHTKCGIPAILSGILTQLEKDPDKAPQVRRFTNHYLPDAVKILTLYADMEETGVSGENAEEVRRQVEANAAVIATAFENQLDSLYSAAALDLDADLEVLKGMLKGQGLVE